MPNQSYVAAKMFKAVLADTDAICKAQTVGAGGGSLTLDGDRVGAGFEASGAANDGSNLATTVTIKSMGSDESGDTFTITGTDSSGNADSENIAGPGVGLTVTTTKAFLTVTAVSVGSALTGNVEVGFTATTSTEGVVFAGATRIRGMHGVSAAATAGNAIFRNTSQTGVIILEMDAPAAAGMMDPYIPDNGCYFTAGAFVDISAGFDSLTVFYDGPNPS